MKKPILLFVMMMSYQFVFSSILVMKFPQGKFKVVLDGSIYWTSQDLQFDQIYPGTKSITIIRESRNNYGQCAYRTVYDGLINVPVQSRVIAHYSRGYLHIETSPLVNRGNPACQQCGQHHISRNCYENHHGNGYYEGPNCRNDRAICNRCGHFHNSNTCSPRYDNRNSSGVILQLMLDENFDSDRLALGLSYVKKGRITAQEISEMALLFTFDSNRLKFAKRAYNFCSNPQDYFLVASTFTFSSNKRELLNFLN